MRSVGSASALAVGLDSGMMTGRSVCAGHVFNDGFGEGAGMGGGADQDGGVDSGDDLGQSDTAGGLAAQWATSLAGRA